MIGCFYVLIILLGLILCFWLLLICVVGIANGPVGLVVFYEQNIKDRVVELGLTTPEQIKMTALWTGIALFLPLFTFVPAMVYLYNGVNGFWDGFLQMTGIFLIMGLFDRLFIVEYWVGHTKAWFIPGTEDLMPYIPAQVKFRKWAGTLVGFPLLAAVIAGVIQLFR